jgi:TetR/AcrR family transcriptional repressor of lmrAB and yxaGH operons
MTSPSTPTLSARERMIESAVVLFRRHGVEGTAFSDVIEHSGAPRGSIYHHFPGGKNQLAEEATRHAAEVLTAGLVAAVEAGDPVAALRSMTRLYAEGLDRTDYAIGCPIAAAALEGERSPGASAAAGETFAAWEDLLAGAFRRSGVPRARSRSLATLSVSAIEGAILVARAQRSSAPLQRVGRELEGLAREALARP